ncbi:MAG: hypothetical protein K2X03_24735 [Bryobacteraceae bacterium]|nr:hypothetical protein [Bryobacteraceae bacterium]
MSAFPAAHHTRIETWRQDEARQQNLDGQLSNARLAVALAGVVVAWLVFSRQALPFGAFLVPVLAFIALAVKHEQVARARDRAQRAIRFHEAALRRATGDWSGQGNPGERFRDAAHPYAEDLDLFGRGSLFELIARTRTAEGEQTLANWLRGAASIDDVRARQAAVAELAPRVEWRERYALAGDDITSGVESRGIAAWATQPAVNFFPGARLVLFLYTLLEVAALVAWLFGWLPVHYFLLLAGGALALSGVLQASVQRIAAGLHQSARDLKLFGELAATVESESFTAPLLVESRHRLAGAARASRSLERLVELLDSSRNQFFGVAALLLLWAPQVSLALENWRQKHAPDAESWIAALGRLEALLSLAAFAFEHPAAISPTLLPAGKSFTGTGIAHPLLPATQAVANDASLSESAPILIVSGSNMSGKSTLLRAIGLNTVLAWSGAPVCCASLAVSPLQVAASLRIVDSLGEGRSRFYAEILRLRQILTLSTTEPVLFLLDEVLSGTNSHDRRTGAEAIIRQLLSHGALGLVTTHDLALTAMDLPGARNVHFADDYVHGELSFDYRMKPGPVQRSNAIPLMRSIGLDV